jgi:hypothetical protein
MTITLYLEANFITGKAHNPFYAKILASKGELLYVGKHYSEGTENYFKGKLTADQQLIQTPEEALEEYLLKKGVSGVTVFIDDALGELKKETLIRLLNSDAQSVFVIARFEDWLHGKQNKYTLSNGFDSFLISRPVITNPQRLLEFVNVFPESEEKVLDWTEHPRKLPVNSYYVFNKSQSKHLDYFAIFDSKNLSFISLEESKQSLPREDKGLIYFNALNKQLKAVVECLQKQSPTTDEIKTFLGDLLNKEMVQPKRELAERIDGVTKQLTKTENLVSQLESDMKRILEQLSIQEKEETEKEENIKKVTIESLFEANTQENKIE